MTANCWEHMRCGREAATVGGVVCPAAICTAIGGVHYGRNGGRACWALDGTLCTGRAKTASEKTADCMACAFFHLVHRDEADNLISRDEIRLLAYGSKGQP